MIEPIRWSSVWSDDIGVVQHYDLKWLGVGAVTISSNHSHDFNEAYRQLNDRNWIIEAWTA